MNNSTFFAYHPKGRGTISCRMLEFVIHHYLKLHHTKDAAATRLYNAYVQKKRSCSVRFFDPQARGIKVQVVNPQCNTAIVSSQCQINFFQWAIEHDLFAFIHQNLTHITSEKSKYNRGKRINRCNSSGNKRKRERDRERDKGDKEKMKQHYRGDKDQSEVLTHSLQGFDQVVVTGRKLSPPRGKDNFTLMGKIIVC